MECGTARGRFQIVGAFDGCIMHLHSTGYLPIDHYVGMNFTAIEMHIDRGGPSASSPFRVTVIPSSTRACTNAETFS